VPAAETALEDRDERQPACHSAQFGGATCELDDRKRWQEFFDTYWKLIYAARALNRGL